MQPFKTIKYCEKYCKFLSLLCKGEKTDGGFHYQSRIMEQDYDIEGSWQQIKNKFDLFRLQLIKCLCDVFYTFHYAKRVIN